MTIYNIHHAQNIKPTINVDETDVDTTSTDLKFFGRRRLQYGQDMNQNILFILEHFACPESTSVPGTPDTTIAVNPENSSVDFTPLKHPVDGQIWYNSTQQRPFVWDATAPRWIPVGMEDDIAANWGIIFDGQQLPQPISSSTGYVFQYSECSWIVSPYQFPEQVDYMLCDTDAEATVSSLYNVAGDPTILKGFATYLIVGIRGNINLGSLSPIPSATPTPVNSQSPTPTPATPSPTPTATPSTSPTYTGNLAAFFAARFPFQNPFYAGAGTTEPYFAGDYRRMQFPGVSTTKYKILYASTAPLVLQTTPAAPHNPWDSVSGNYFIYILDAPSTGSLGSFFALNALYHGTIFCTGKSTETGTAMVEGVDGIFYKVSNITKLNSTITQITLTVTALANPDFALYGHPPLQVSPIDLLQFNYDYVYATGSLYNNNTGLVTGQTARASCTGVAGTDPNAIFYMCPPTPYEGAYDLYVQGGTPPYTITDIRYFGPLGTGVFTSFASNKIPSITKSGFVASGSTSLPAPVSFTDLNTATTTKPLFVGPITFPNSNTNVQLVPNGYVVRNYVTADFNYGKDYATKFGTSCKPEYLWYWQYPGEGTSCANLTGNGTSYCFDTFCVLVKDSLGTTTIASTGFGGNFQTIDFDLMNQNFSFSALQTSGPASGAILGAGTYTYGLQVSLGMIPTALRPLVSPAKLQYVFSLLDSGQGNTIDPTQSGQFVYSSVTGTTTTALMKRPSSGNLPPPGTNSSNALIHVGCDISNANPDLQCATGGYLPSAYPPTVGPLTPGVNQSIRISKVWRNDGTPGVVTLSSPIIVTLTVLAAPIGSMNNINTYNWINLLTDRTGNHTGSFTSPRVPYNMKIDVTIPTGLSFSGTLLIPYAYYAYDNPGGGASLGTSGGPLGTILLNFSHT